MKFTYTIDKDSTKDSKRDTDFSFKPLGHYLYLYLIDGKPT